MVQTKVRAAGHAFRHVVLLKLNVFQHVSEEHLRNNLSYL